MSSYSCIDQYVSIRGLVHKYCDVIPHKILADTSFFAVSDYSTMKNNSFVFVVTETLHKFINLVSTQNIRINLITGAGVISVPMEISQKYNIDWKTFVTQHVIKWYTQNIDIVKHPIIKPLPLGVNFHTLSENKNHFWGEYNSVCKQNAQLANVKLMEFDQKMNKVFVPHMARMHRYNNDRAKAYSKLNRRKPYLEFQMYRIKRLKLWEKMSRYKFILSPLGMGMDCHRTWETFAVGSIPIIKNSTLVPTLFRSLKNVIVVNDWKQVNQKSVDMWIHQFKHTKTNEIVEYAKMDYWDRMFI